MGRVILPDQLLYFFILYYRVENKIDSTKIEFEILVVTTVSKAMSVTAST